VTEGRNYQIPTTSGLETGPVDIQTELTHFAVFNETLCGGAEVFFEDWEIVTLKNVGTCGLTVEDLIKWRSLYWNPLGIPVIVGWQKNIPSLAVKTVKEGPQPTVEIGKGSTLECEIILHDHDSLPFRMFFLNYFETLDVTQSTTEGTIGVLNRRDTMDFVGGYTHTLEFGFQVFATIFAVVEIDVQNGINLIHCIYT
jgi:hypothetical protein